MGIKRPIMIVGDVHGHLQLALSLAYLWQEELNVKFEAILFCGDVGSFTSEEELDSATRSHAKKNPIELEFLYQWMGDPQPPWIEAIFKPKEEGGFGIDASLVMVHGNHEGFGHLKRIVPNTLPKDPVDVGELPSVDPGERLRYLPSGWAFRTPGGTKVGGVGGIDPESRKVDYHGMAWIDKRHVDNLIRMAPFDILITHQGPEEVQRRKGTSLLNPLLRRRVARFWFHGHGMDSAEIRTVGNMKVVPLSTLAYGKGEDLPDERSIAVLLPDGDDVRLIRGLPKRYRELRRNRWIPVEWNGRTVLVSPLLTAHAFKY